MASTSVVLPWSTWAMIATLRMSSRVAIPAAKGDRRRSLVSTRMEHRTLGRTGVKVSPLCLGAMMFGAWGERDHDESIRIIHRALDAGINFIDTADVYSAGESEEIVGKALAGGRRDDVILATKVHGSMGDDPNQFGNSRRWIVREVENSLRRLSTDWIDLYQIHRPEHGHRHRRDARRADRPRPRGQGALHRLLDVPRQPDRRGPVDRRAARPRALRLRAAALLAAGRAAIEADVLPTCRRHGMGVIPWSPLAGGWLSGKWRKGADDLTSRRSAMLPQALRPLDPGQPAQARRGRRARRSWPTRPA